jgi:hypothetical protein
MGAERADHVAGETTDAETEIESGEFLKSKAGEYLTSAWHWEIKKNQETFTLTVPATPSRPLTERTGGVRV